MHFLFVLAILLSGCAHDTAHPLETKHKTAQTVVEVIPSSTKPALRFYRSLVPANAVIFPIQAINEQLLNILTIVVEQAEKENRELLLVFDSPGGEVMVGLRIASLLENSGVKVNCIADSLAGSMGAYIFLSCDERWATPKARFLFHGPRFSSNSKNLTIMDVKDDLSEIESLQEAFCTHVAYSSKWARKDCLSAIGNGQDVWMGAEEAVRLGIASKIISPKPKLP